MLQVRLIWTGWAMCYKRDTLFGRQGVAIHSSCCSDAPLSLPPGADLCMQWHFHGWGVASSPPQRVWGLFLLCAFLCVIHVTPVSLPSCFSAPHVISSLLLLLASHGKYTELLHVRNTLSKRRVFLLINGTKALALGGDKAENKLLQVCFRETRGLTSSPCQWWNSRLKWQQGCTLGTF